MSRVFSLASSAIAVGLFLLSSVADAGIIRRAGSSASVAPPAPGTTHLVSNTVQVGDPFPSVDPDHVFSIGYAPGVMGDFAGDSTCLYHTEDCWGEYVPGELIEFTGAIWGGNTTADLTYEFTVKDSLGTVLFTFDQDAPETTTHPILPNSDATNPCWGVHFYGSGSGNCQAFSVAFLLPDTIPFYEWLEVGFRATYTAPAGMIFAWNGFTEETVSSLGSEMTIGPSYPYPIQRVPPLPEGPASLLALFGLLGLLKLKARRTV